MKNKMIAALALTLLCAFNSRLSTTFAQGATIYPIATSTSLEELSGGIAASGSNYLVGYLSGSNICFQMASTNGALLGSAVTIGTSEGNPHVAASKTSFLEVWFDDFTATTFGQIISSSGTKVGSAFSLGSVEDFGLASDGTNFLVVLNNNGYQGNYYAYGQLVSPAGALLGSQFLISSQVANGKQDAVAFGKTNYLVVWFSQNVVNEGNTNLVYGSFVSGNGSAGSPFQIGQTPAPDQSFLNVAFDGTNYLAAWMWDPYPETGGSVTNWNIYGRLVSQTGTFPANELQLVTDPGNDGFPSLAFDGTNYLLLWSYGFNVITNTNIRFQFFNRTGSAITPEFTLFTAQGTNSPLIAINGLLFDGTQYAMAATLGAEFFSSGDIYGGILSPSFSLRPPRITAFQKNGLLTWTNAPGTNLFVLQSLPAPAWINPPGANAFFLQRASVLTGPWSYASSPLDLTISTNIQTTVTVPLVPPIGFYRVTEGFGPQSLHGAWILPATGTTNAGQTYFMADGNSTITNFGLFNLPTPPGYYSVSYAGGVTLTIDPLEHGTMSLTGQFMPARQIVFTGLSTNLAAMAIPVEDVTLCAGTWSGTLSETNDPNGLSDYSVSLMVTTNGLVSFSGALGAGSGCMFSLAPTNGASSAFIKTGLNASNPYNQIQLNGTLSGNTFTGSFDTDSGTGVDAIIGTVTLTR